MSINFSFSIFRGFISTESKFHFFPLTLQIILRYNSYISEDEVFGMFLCVSVQQITLPILGSDMSYTCFRSEVSGSPVFEQKLFPSFFIQWWKTIVFIVFNPPTKTTFGMALPTLVRTHRKLLLCTWNTCRLCRIAAHSVCLYATELL